MTSDSALRLRSRSSKNAVVRQWRNWRTGQIIETVEAEDKKYEESWDAEFEPVVLFHHVHGAIVFCDPLEEALSLDQRHSGCEIISLELFNQLVGKYGGENVHGPNAWPYERLTLLELLEQNAAIRRELMR